MQLLWSPQYVRQGPTERKIIYVHAVGQSVHGTGQSKCVALPRHSLIGDMDEYRHCPMRGSWSSGVCIGYR